jgi:urease gamma subunit
VQEISIALALCAVGAAVWYMRRRDVGAGRVRGWLLVYDDLGGWRALPAVYADSGVVADGVTYPASLPVVRVDRTLVWIARCDAAALIEHQALERAREAAALASLWKGGGQWLDLLRVMGVVLPAVFAYFTWAQVSALQALVVQILALVGER